jgi:hypothetical protein
MDILVFILAGRADHGTMATTTTSIREAPAASSAVAAASRVAPVVSTSSTS